MRRILESFRDEWQWWVTLALCLSVALVFVLWVMSHRAPKPVILDEQAVVGRTSVPDAGSEPDYLVRPEDDGLKVFKINDVLPIILPQGVMATAAQTVVVRVHGEGGGIWYGSGFVLRRGLIVSAAHILDHVSEPYAPIVTCNGNDADGTILAFDRGRDIVLIEADCPGARRPLDLHPLTVNETLYLAGYTYSFPGLDGDVTADRYVKTASPILGARLSDLPVSAFSADIAVQLTEMRKRNLARHQAVTGIAIPGHSGSAVTRPDGSVVGVMVIRDPQRGRSFIIPARHIAQLIKKYGIPF